MDPRNNSGQKYGGNRNGKRTAAAMLALVVLALILYIASFPLPIYDKYERAIRDGETPEYDLLTDPDALKNAHAAMIRETKIMYELRRDQILKELKDPNGAIGQAAGARCRELAASEYNGAAIGNISWDIPEEHFTLSDREADALLYLYSCQFDWDFLNGSPDFYQGWLYGFDDIERDYEIEGFGTTFTLKGRGGYYMPQNRLDEARAEAKKHADAAVAEQRLRDSGSMILAALVSPFVDVAYADESIDYDGIWEKEYEDIMHEYAERYGSSCLDTVVYTGISERIDGVISFSVSGTPSAEFGPFTVEDFAMGTGGSAEAVAAVEEYGADPMKGRVVVIPLTTENEFVSADNSYGYPIYFGTQGQQVSGPLDPDYNETRWYTYKDKTISKKVVNRVYVMVYPVIESVDFTLHGNVNISARYIAPDSLAG